MIKTLIFLLLITSCASTQSSVPMESRNYDICQDLSGFCWNYEVCAKKFLGICMKRELRTDKIEVEFKDKVKAKTLLDMNFILRVRAKPL